MLAASDRAPGSIAHLVYVDAGHPSVRAIRGFLLAPDGATLVPSAMTTLGEVMSRGLVTVPSDATVAEAATLMSTHHVGSALVCDGDRLRGIFTERDIVRALATDFDAARERVAEWMTTDPSTLGPSASVEEARDLMLEEGFRHVPVLDDGRVVGVVSLRDLSRP